MIRKRNVLVFLFCFGLIIVAANNLQAATCDPSAHLFCNPLNTGGDGIDTVADALIVVIQFLLSVIGVISLLFIIVSGIKYITSAGNEESIKSAKNTLTSSISGLILALLAYGIVEALEKILQVK